MFTLIATSLFNDDLSEPIVLILIKNSLMCIPNL